jgi:hypothetical protein
MPFYDYNQKTRNNMNSQDKILHCYNEVADDYAVERWGELILRAGYK